MERNLLGATCGDGSACLLRVPLKNQPSASPLRGLRRGSRCALWMFQVGAAALGVIAGLGSQSAQAQAPSILWATNIGAQVFTVDVQTNVCANSNGTVFVLSSTGAVLQMMLLNTNVGLAQRDAAGNYYYAGTYPGVPGPPYGLNYPNGPACFLANYDSSGTRLWSADFGPQGSIRAVAVNDLQVDPATGVAYVGYTWNVTTTAHYSVATRYDSTGSNTWSAVMPKVNYYTTLGTLRFGGITPTNGYVVTFSSFIYAMLSQFDSTGNATVLSSWTASSYLASKYSRTAMNAQGQIYNVEDYLTKRAGSGEVIWTQTVGLSPAWTVGNDLYGGAYVAADSGPLSRYDYDGNLVWTVNSLTSPVNGIALDSVGNRFISLSNGVVARLSGEILSSPVITNAPQSQTVLAGSNVVFTVSVSGSAPLQYFWFFNNGALPNATNSTLDLGTVETNQAGSYSVIVSNFAGSVTSAPAVLRVKRVELYFGNQLLTNGTYTFATPPTLSVHSAFTNGSIYYTLDGSTPNFGSMPYSGPFTVTHSATVRAIGYSSDFSQSEEADVVNAFVVVNHKLTASASGGGSVTLNPPGGTYASTNIVTATGVASNGWSFLYWLGDASGTNATVNISMERDKTIYAVFGTVLSTTVAGNGAVQLNPPGGLYPFGSVVRLTGVPQAGNYFGAWGNAASGNTNPLYFTITTPNPTVSSIFGALSPGQAALTVMINGSGRVNVNPRANVYGTSQTVTLTATPDAGQTFLNWSGDASGALNPLSVLMSQSKVITANFSSHPALRVSQSGLEGLTADGFRFTLLSDPQMIWQILGSSNLSSWQYLGTVTNVEGQVQFTDPGAVSLPNRFYKAAPGP